MMKNMQRMAIPLTGPTGGYIGQQLDPARTVNLYNATIVGLDAPVLISIPGTQTKYTHVGGDNTRNLFQTGDTLFAVFSDEIVAFDNALATTSVGTINTLDGRVNFAANNNKQVMVVDGVDGWVIDLNTLSLTQITDPTFTGINNPIDVDYLDGHMFVVFGEGNEWLLSDLEDATTYDALNTAKLTSSGNQKLKGVRVVGGRIFIFGDTVTEVWYPTGQASLFPFARDNNSVIQYGCAANGSICAGNIQIKSMYRIFPDVEPVVIWLGYQKSGAPTVVMSLEGQTSVISDIATEYKIQKLSKIDDAIGYLFKINGHTFYLLTFPTGNLTLVYDFDMKLWHEQEMIDGNCYFSSSYAYFGNKHYLGHLASAKLSELNEDYFSNDEEAIHCVRTTSIFNLPSYERLSITRFELNMRKGTGYKTTEPKDGYYDNFNISPKVYLSQSINGGYTYSQKRETKVGEVGEANWEVVWTGFDISQRHSFNIETFNNTKVILLSAFVQLQNLGY